MVKQNRPARTRRLPDGNRVRLISHSVDLSSAVDGLWEGISLVRRLERAGTDRKVVLAKGQELFEEYQAIERAIRKSALAVRNSEVPLPPIFIDRSESARRLNALWIKLGISQSWIASALGISKDVVRAWGNPDRKTFYRMTHEDWEVLIEKVASSKGITPLEVAMKTK